MPESFAPYAGDPRSAYENAKFYQRYSVQRLEWMQRTAKGDINAWGDDNAPFEKKDNSISDLPALLLGISRFRVREDGFTRFNSTVFKDKGAGAVSFYDKRKLVMFGEYIPFAEKLEWVYDSLGMAVLGVGQQWESFEVDGVSIAPSICFEDMLPQAMQNQTASLVRQNKSPEVLVNVTNDGWFRGSSMLDHHFACAVFTAVENRRPMLVAANTGISTWVNGNGEVKQNQNGWQQRQLLLNRKPMVVGACGKQSATGPLAYVPFPSFCHCASCGGKGKSNSIDCEGARWPQMPNHEPLWQQREEALLASYATFSSHSRGRVHPEPPHAYRGPFQRDRDRVLHSAAFRRLSGKMQVFTGDMGDYHRTRLTHTQEVASIARTIGRQLRLNEDLIEALALLHDVGHPPYGHCGEDALDRCLEHHGGFSHNAFALQLIQQLETRYTGIPGLNLSYEVLAGQTHRANKGR